MWWWAWSPDDILQCVVITKLHTKTIVNYWCFFLNFPLIFRGGMVEVAGNPGIPEERLGTEFLWELVILEFLRSLTVHAALSSMLSLLYCFSLV